MPFVERFTLMPSDARVPGRVYVHDLGHVRFQDETGRHTRAHKYASDIINNHPDPSFYDAKYVIGALWGSAEEDVFELSGYDRSDIKGWKGTDPEGRLWIFRNGIWRPDLRAIDNGYTSEDFDIVKGREGEYRKRTHSLLEFLKGTPELPPGLLLSE
jgi:hypothetical protein